MMYPRIYSLSTVGILKHYVHDYLFHPLRTDFIGPNGVGKSIIADLMQLMFIYDTSLIKFGTDGVKKEERSIYKLPYKISTGYCFLNIEVENGKFLIVGIAIHSQTGMRIMPFVITRSSELTGEFRDLSLNKEELLTARDFLQADIVPDLKTLATKLLQERNLFLSFFRTKDEVKRYYQFLFDKNILSINLTVEENLSAFAKVIQSFSKAKSLDLTHSKASKSLKEFLFEDSEAELQEEYHKQQGLLQKLLREFAELDRFTKLLRQKQDFLLNLKKLDQTQRVAFKDYKKGEVQQKYTLFTTVSKQEQETQITLKKEQEREKELELKIKRFPLINKRLTQAFDTANQYLISYSSYQQYYSSAEEQDKDLVEMKLLNPPLLKGNWPGKAGEFDITTRTPVQIKSLIELGRPYFNTGKSFSDIERQFMEQKNQIGALTQEIKNEKEYLEKLISILEKQTSDTVLNWALTEKKNFSPEQKSLLFYYATLATKKPLHPQKGSQCIDPEKLIAEGNVEIDKPNNGFWVELGALKEFVVFDKDAEQFLDSQNITQIAYVLLEKTKSDRELLNQKEKELENVVKGKPYDRKILNEDFDLFLADYGNVEKLKEAAGCIHNLQDKIKQLQKQKDETEQLLYQIKKQLPSNIKYSEPEVVQRELKTIVGRDNKRTIKWARFETQLTNELIQIKDTISKHKEDLRSTTNLLLTTQREFAELNEKYFLSFNENLQEEDFNDTTAPLDQLQSAYRNASGDYTLKYHETVNRFEETAESAHIGVNRELAGKTYEFAVLEEALLGLKIRHTDDIAPALEEANRGRLSMADDIKNTMVKIFDSTLFKFKQYQNLVYAVNTFFQGRKISDQFFFAIKFSKNTQLRIELVEEIGNKVRNAARQGELPFDRPVSDFIEEFFKKAARINEKVPIEKLLDPKTYFDLSVSLSDETGIDIPGSTGETYSAIALLGIARLSIVQKEKRKGLRFIILEELGSLDSSNFSTFPAIAKEFNYQIVTMAPSPFRTALSDEWYAHHLIKGISDKNINYHPSASYFKTKDRSEDLFLYLKLLDNELDRTKSITPAV